MEIVSRKEAITLGLKVYFTGKPCSRGHIAPRKIAGSTCRECHRLDSAVARKTDKNKECNRLAQRRYRAKYPDRIKTYQEKNKDKIIARAQKWQEENPKRIKAIQSKSFQKNKAKRMATHQAWKLTNPEQWRVLQSAARANRRARETVSERSSPKI